MAPRTPPGLPSDPLFQLGGPSHTSDDKESNSYVGPPRAEPVQILRRIPTYDIDMLIPSYEATGPGSDRLIANVKIAELLAQYKDGDPKFDRHPAPGVTLLETMRYRIRLKRFALLCIEHLDLATPEDYCSFSYTHWRFHATSAQRAISDSTLTLINGMRIFPAPKCREEGCPFRKPHEYLIVAFAKNDIPFSQVSKALLSSQVALRKLRESVFVCEYDDRCDSGIAGLERVSKRND